MSGQSCQALGIAVAVRLPQLLHAALTLQPVVAKPLMPVEAVVLRSTYCLACVVFADVSQLALGCSATAVADVTSVATLDAVQA